MPLNQLVNLSVKFISKNISVLLNIFRIKIENGLQNLLSKLRNSVVIFAPLKIELIDLLLQRPLVLQMRLKLGEVTE